MRQSSLQRKTTPRSGPAALVVVAVVALLWLGAPTRRGWGQDDLSSAVMGPVALENVLVGVIDRCEESVVAIARVRVQRPGEGFAREFRPDPFGRRRISTAAANPTDPDFIPNQFATGVVVDRRGLILTAAHVLADDSEYYITTHDRKVYTAEVKAADPRSDLAVLSVKADDLIPIALGDGGHVRKGQIVIALGNPYAIARDGEASASWGLVANVARKAPPVLDEFEPTGRSTLHHFGTLIQTDAKLNLGTSGGPLLNLQGKMVGLTTSTAAMAGYETAAGFAMPVDTTFRRVLDTLKEGREVEYGFLGIQPANLTIKERLAGLRGMRIRRVVPGTPADQYDLMEDDLVTAVDGVPIFDADDLMLQVGRMPVEAVPRISFIRDDRPREIEVPLAKYPHRSRPIVTSRRPPWRGMRIDYSTALFNADGGVLGGSRTFDGGVLVTEVKPGTPAWEAGLRRGMMIGQIGSTKIGSPGDFRTAVSGKAGTLQVHLVDEEDGSAVRAVGPEA